MKQKYYLFISIIWSLIIAFLSLKNTSELPDIEFDHIDKIGHFLVYGLLTWLLYKTGVAYKMKSPLLIALVIPIAYGAFMEFAQGYLSLYRSAELNDALANTFGALFVGLVLFLRR